MFVWFFGKILSCPSPGTHQILPGLCNGLVGCLLLPIVASWGFSHCRAWWLKGCGTSPICGRPVSELQRLGPAGLTMGLETGKWVVSSSPACVPDLIRVALHCLDNVKDADGSLRALRIKIANFLASNLNKN